MTDRKSTDLIVIHCSATRPGQDIGVLEIDKWHKARGWESCGYHFVIRRFGKVEVGRPLMAIGAHAGGHNDESVGICMVGGVDADDIKKAVDNFTKEQWIAVEAVVRALKTMWPKAKIIGHREISLTPKACPSFDVQLWKELVGLGD